MSRDLVFLPSVEDAQGLKVSRCFSEDTDDTEVLEKQSTPLGALPWLWSCAAFLLQPVSGAGGSRRLTEPVLADERFKHIEGSGHGICSSRGPSEAEAESARVAGPSFLPRPGAPGQALEELAGEGRAEPAEMLLRSSPRRAVDLQDPSLVGRLRRKEVELLQVVLGVSSVRANSVRRDPRR